MKMELADGRNVYIDFIVVHAIKGNHMTICLVRDAEPFVKEKEHSIDGLLAQGVAQCSPKDKYNKATGKVKALDRALQELLPGPKNRQFRFKIWEEFFNHLQTKDVRLLNHRQHPRIPFDKP